MQSKESEYHLRVLPLKIVIVLYFEKYTLNPTAFWSNPLDIIGGTMLCMFPLLYHTKKLIDDEM